MAWCGVCLARRPAWLFVHSSAMRSQSRVSLLKEYAPSPVRSRRGLSVSATAPPQQRPWKLILEPGHSSRYYWADIWRYRELMAFLAWRDVVVRYKQTAIGLTWTLLRPAITMLVFVAFRRLFGIHPA